MHFLSFKYQSNTVTKTFKVYESIKLKKKKRKLFPLTFSKRKVFFFNTVKTKKRERKPFATLYCSIILNTFLCTLFYILMNSIASCVQTNYFIRLYEKNKLSTHFLKNISQPIIKFRLKNVYNLIKVVFGFVVILIV